MGAFVRGRVIEELAEEEAIRRSGHDFELGLERLLDGFAAEIGPG